MKLYFTFLIIFYGLLSRAEFSNPALVKLVKEDWTVEFSLNNCIEADQMSSLNFIGGDTSMPNKTVKIYYQHVVTNDNLPTLIYFPGGPGGNSIGDYEEFEHLSHLFNILLIDPRGFGCNFLGKDFSDYKNIRSERVASDIVKIVQKENLQNFYIYGVSFGTLLGTISTYELEKKGLYPKALILEGILGHSFKNWASLYEQQISVNFNTYIKKNVWLIDLLNKVDFLGQDSKVFFDNFIRGLFRDNGTIAPDESTLLELKKIRNLSDQQLNNYILEKNRLVGKQSLDENLTLQSQMKNFVSCNEISKEDINFESTWDKISKKVIAVKISGAKDLCSKDGFSNRYDSEKYQISTPIYYFQGSEDPATPLESAKYHFQSQKKAKKYFVEVESAGHSPFYEALEGCSLEIWNSISKETPLNRILNSKGICF